MVSCALFPFRVLRFSLIVPMDRTLVEFTKKDDAWFTAALKEPGWGGGPANNFCLWFHVCEHILHHAGQIGFLIKRLPGAKNDDSAG
jgi:hypothetical protein